MADDTMKNPVLKTGYDGITGQDLWSDGRRSPDPYRGQRAFKQHEQ
jgi:hypothetical protein